MTRIDAHQHFWELGRFDYDWLNAEPLEPIRRSFLPSDLKPLIDDVGIEATIFVQTQHNVTENNWVLEFAEQHEFIRGVVGWVDLASERCEDQLLEFKDRNKFVGIRHITHDEPDDDFIIRADVRRGLKILERHGMPFDLLFFAKHLKHAVTLARDCPNLPMVIDHLAKPEIKHHRMDNWIDDFRAAADCPNIFCKLSGMITEADWQSWKPEHLRPYIETAIDCFGPERCMFGSDWPVCELAGSYRQVHDALTECIRSLSQDEQAAIMGGTAQKFYGLTL